MKTQKVLAVLLVIIGLYGCKSNSTSPSSGGQPLVAANPGSVFHLQVTTTDTNGMAMGSTIHQTDSIVAKGITFMGKSNVVKIWSYDDQGNSGYGYYSLLDNGDLDFYLGDLRPGMVAQWMEWPFGTGSPLTTTIEDTSIMGIEHVSESATYSRGGTSTMTVQGNSLTLNEVVGIYTVTQSISIQGVSQSNSSTLPPFHYYWSPTIGFLAKSQVATTDMFGQPMIETQILTSYTLQ